MALTKRSVARGRVFHDCDTSPMIPRSAGLGASWWDCSVCGEPFDPINLRKMIRRGETLGFRYLA